LFPEQEEPKELSRIIAWTALPRQEFVVADGDEESALDVVVPVDESVFNDGKPPKPITVSSLEVPSTLKRHFFFGAYVALCVLSWILFVRTMSILEPQHFVPTSP